MFNIKRNRIKTEYEQAKEELFEARQALNIARQAFNYADHDYFKAANASLTAAEERYKLSYNRIKSLAKDTLNGSLDIVQIENTNTLQN